MHDLMSQYQGNYYIQAFLIIISTTMTEFANNSMTLYSVLCSTATRKLAYTPTQKHTTIQGNKATHHSSGSQDGVKVIDDSTKLKSDQ